MQNVKIIKNIDSEISAGELDALNASTSELEYVPYHTGGEEYVK